MSSTKFLQAMVFAGVIPPAKIQADGILHRFSSSGKAGDLSGWYVFHPGVIPFGIFGCWRRGLKQYWREERVKPLTLSEQKAVKMQAARAIALQKKQAFMRNQRAQKEAVSRWHAGTVVSKHPYLTAKGIEPYELRCEGNLLLVPIHDVHGKLQSLQIITSEGFKRFIPGGRIQGCFHSIGLPSPYLLICEGVATAYAIHAATGLWVHAALCAGNLLSTANSLRKRYPQHTIILAADDDDTSDSNTGIIAARHAAMAVGGIVVLPVFPKFRHQKSKDFNDLYLEVGPESVRACFAEVIDEVSND